MRAADFFVQDFGLVAVDAVVLGVRPDRGFVECVILAVEGGDFHYACGFVLRAP